MVACGRDVHHPGTALSCPAGCAGGPIMRVSPGGGLRTEIVARRTTKRARPTPRGSAPIHPRCATPRPLPGDDARSPDCAGGRRSRRGRGNRRGRSARLVWRFFRAMTIGVCSSHTRSIVFARLARASEYVILFMSGEMLQRFSSDDPRCWSVFTDWRPPAFRRLRRRWRPEGWTSLRRRASCRARSVPAVAGRCGATRGP